MLSKSQLAKTKVAFGFGLVGVSGMFVNQALFWFFHDVMSFWISWAAIAATQGSTIWNFVLIDESSIAGTARVRAGTNGLPRVGPQTQLRCCSECPYCLGWPTSWE